MTCEGGCGEFIKFGHHLELNVTTANGKEQSGNFCDACADEIFGSCIPKLASQNISIIIQLEWKRPSHESLKIFMSLPIVLTEIIINYYSSVSNFIMLQGMNFEIWKKFEQQTYRAARCRAMIIDSKKEIRTLTKKKFQTPDMTEEEWCRFAWQKFKCNHGEDMSMDWMSSEKFLNQLIEDLRELCQGNGNDDWFDRPTEPREKLENIENKIKKLETKLLLLREKLKKLYNNDVNNENLSFLEWNNDFFKNKTRKRRLSDTEHCQSNEDNVNVNVKNKKRSRSD